MKLIRATNYDDLSKKTAQIILDQIKGKEKFNLGLATGATPLGIYNLLIKKYNEDLVSYEHITTFNLDEYVGLSKEDPNSYHYYMRDHLFKHIDIPESQIHIPNGNTSDLEQECQNYENKIKNAGGIDLQILGIGINGHIGFNEPNTSFQSRTHIVKLDTSTRIANSRFFSDLSEVPTKAITMGIKTIMESKQILLLVSGKQKAKILNELINNTMIHESVPASILKKHPNVTVIADERALSELQNEERGKAL